MTPRIFKVWFFPFSVCIANGDYLQFFNSMICPVQNRGVNSNSEQERAAPASPEISPRFLK